MAKEWLIGRAPTCQVVVDDPQVSRWHARLTESDGHYFIEDVGSSSGTCVNGVPVHNPTVVRYGDIIQLGNTPIDTRMEPLASILSGRADVGPVSSPGAQPEQRRSGRRGNSPNIWLFIAPIVVVCVVIAVVLISRGGSEGGGDTLPASVKKAVFMVTVHCDGKGFSKGRTGYGGATGFVAQGVKAVVTNAHVAKKIKEAARESNGRCRGVVIGNENPELRLTVRDVQIHSGWTTRGRKGAWRDEKFKAAGADVALLFVEEPNRLPKGIPLASPKEVKNKALQGKDVAILGFPGETLNPHEPIATQDWGTVGRVIHDDYIQMSISMSPGNSGSPVMLRKGVVVGIASVLIGGSRALVIDPETNKPTEKLVDDGSQQKVAVGIRFLKDLLRGAK